MGVYAWKQRCGKLDTNIRITEITEAPEPKNIEEAKKMTTILCTSITLMVYALPMQSFIQHKRQDLEDHYEWFWGKEMALSSAAPSLPTLMSADALCWKQAAIKMHA